MYTKLKVTEMGRMTPQEFKQSQKTPLAVVLDHVRSLYNVGSIFRTADAMRLSEVILCGITATPPNTEIHKTALGAEDTVDWKYFTTTAEAIQYLRTQGYTIIAIEQCKDSIKLQDFKPHKEEKYAIILGTEVKGVHQEIVDMSDTCIEIPQFGTKHSMNVSVTAGMVIWDLVKSYLHSC